MKYLLAAILGMLALSPASAQQGKETRYLAFQIFTYSPDPHAAFGPDSGPTAGLPDKASLRTYIGDIRQKVGTAGTRSARLAVILGPVSFEHTDQQVTRFLETGFDLALETGVAVGFHIDDSMFWARRKDLASDPANLEVMDWNGTVNTGRRLDWGKVPASAPPQLCFNAKAVRQAVEDRSALIGKAIAKGLARLEQEGKPELFAGVIAGWETMIGEDFKTGSALGYRALMNRGYSANKPPQDMDRERESVVSEFIALWAKGLEAAGVPEAKVYSHIAFQPGRVFEAGNHKDATYSQRNHFTPPSAAFGEPYRPGFSTYPQPGLFEDIHAELAKHPQTGWASSEGTNLRLGAKPGESGMTMETYLAKVFNHGGTLVNLYSWGVGGDAHKDMDFRVVTEGEEALLAYRRFLRGDPLVEGEAIQTSSLADRMPAKIQRIQAEAPAWIQSSPENRAKGFPLIQKLRQQMGDRNFAEAEVTADAILKMLDAKP